MRRWSAHRVPGNAEPLVLALRHERAVLVSRAAERSSAVDDLHAIEVTFFALIGRLTFQARGEWLGLTDPAPFADRAGTLVRAVRRPSRSGVNLPTDRRHSPVRASQP